jgi:hypothetical protein
VNGSKARDKSKKGFLAAEDTEKENETTDLHG